MSSVFICVHPWFQIPEHLAYASAYDFGMNMTTIVNTFLLLVAICSMASADERPNIILIIADDMNWNDCGAYGHPSIRTPNIDSLARDGLKFNHAYLTVSSCSPSRSSIITGKYPHNTGAEQLHWPLPATARHINRCCGR